MYGSLPRASLTLKSGHMIEPLPRARYTLKKATSCTDHYHTRVEHNQNYPNKYNHKDIQTFIMDQIPFNTFRLSFAIPSSRCFDTHTFIIIHSKAFVMFRLGFAIPFSRCFDKPSLSFYPNSLNKFEHGISSATIILFFLYFWFIISFKIVLN